MRIPWTQSHRRSSFSHVKCAVDTHIFEYLHRGIDDIYDSNSISYMEYHSYHPELNEHSHHDDQQIVTHAQYREEAAYTQTTHNTNPTPHSNQTTVSDLTRIKKKHQLKTHEVTEKCGFCDQQEWVSNEYVVSGRIENIHERMMNCELTAQRV